MFAFRRTGRRLLRPNQRFDRFRKSASSSAASAAASGSDSDRRSFRARGSGAKEADGNEAAAAADAPALFDWNRIEEEKREWPDWLVSELRSDHAGETGAVWIYKGAHWAMKLRGASARAIHSTLGVDAGCPYRLSGSEPAFEFVEEHMETEGKHLELMEQLLPAPGRSKLLPLWRISGFALGALPTILWRTPTWLYVTVEAVETFVEAHYLNHIVPLEKEGKAPELVRLLRHCCEEEVHHRDDAASRTGMPPGVDAKPFLVRLWFKIVAGGSEAAVALAKRI